MMDEVKAVALERKFAGMTPTVADRHTARIGLAATAHVCPAGRCGLGEDLGAVIHDVVERRLDRIRGGLRLEDLIDDLDHGELLYPRRLPRRGTNRIVAACDHGRWRMETFGDPTGNAAMRAGRLRSGCQLDIAGLVPTP